MAAGTQRAGCRVGSIPGGSVSGRVVDAGPGAHSEKHLGHKYDSKQISRIVARATKELESWRQRSLQGQRYKFLYLDGANFRVRINGHVSVQSFCAVLGVSEENERFEVLALEM